MFEPSGPPKQGAPSIAEFRKKGPVIGSGIGQPVDEADLPRPTFGARVTITEQIPPPAIESTLTGEHDVTDRGVKKEAEMASQPGNPYSQQDFERLQRRNQELETEAKLAAVESRLDKKIDGLVEEVRAMRSEISLRFTKAEAEQSVLSERISSVWKYVVLGVGLIVGGSTYFLNQQQANQTNRLMDFREGIRAETRLQINNEVERRTLPTPKAPNPAGKSGT